MASPFPAWRWGGLILSREFLRLWFVFRLFRLRCCYCATTAASARLFSPLFICLFGLLIWFANLVKGTAPEKIVPDRTLSDGGGAPEHQSPKPGTAELCAIPVWWESMHKREKWTLFTSVPPKFSRGKQATSRASSRLVTGRTDERTHKCVL